MKNLNIAAMMKQAQMMQSRMQEVQDEVGQKTVEASAGGGMVTVTANGKGEILSVKLDPKALADGDIEMLEDLVLAALHDAVRKINESQQASFGGLVPPGIDGLLGQ